MMEEVESDTSNSDDDDNLNVNFTDWLDEYGSDNDERTWQDNEPYGDQIQPKLAGHTRVYFSNIRGIKDQAKWAHVCSAMSDINADVAGFSEMNVDTAQEAIRLRLEKAARSSIPGQSILITSSTPDIAASDMKPGGTSLLTIGGGNCSRITSSYKDTMGRWAATRYQLDEGIKGLWVISVYQVCDGIIDPKSFTAARQQQAMILDPAIKPRQAFKKDLSEFIAKYPEDEFLIGGDFNEEVTSPEMANLIDNLHLYDLITARHGEAACPHTYIRGKKRIDFILGTEHVMQAMTTCGYESYGLRYQSDHRGMWMDIDTVLLFGSETTPMNIQEKRGLSAREPRDVLNWVTATAKYLNDHNMNERCQQINARTILDNEFAEKFDRDMTKGSLWGEKQANKLRPKSHWSPAFAEAWARVFFYNQAWSFRRNRVKMQDVLTSIKLRYKLEDEIPAPRDINRRRKAAQRKLKKIRLKARELRREFLRLKAQAYARAQKVTDAAVLKKMQQSEAMSKVFQKIKRSDSSSIGAVDKLEIPRIQGTPPKECTDWRTTTIPEEIEEALLTRNQEHFGQAEGTPCTSAAMKESLGYRGNGPIAEPILEGQYDDATLDTATSLFLKHLKRKGAANQVEAKITRQQFLSKIKNWPERTSTSPSKLHLGMYHALLKPCGLEPRDNQPNSAMFNKFIQNRDLIIDCRLAIINYALRWGYSFERWKDVENIMIRKDANNCRIHRLRVIHIYEADYNLILGIKWREALHHAEDERLLNEGTYGSRPGRSAHDPVLLEIFQNEIYRLSGKSGVAFDLDAASCYDRILAALASLSSQKYGMHHKVALVNAITLEEARFKLKTKLGASACFYKHTEDNPIHGTSQGSQNSPTIWLFVCSTLFDAFEETANGAVFESYDKKESITLYMVGFVDDCSQRVNDFRAHPQPPPEVLIEKMRQDAQRWNDLLWSSGGLLEASKCSYHLITTTTDQRGIPMLNPSRCNLELNIQSPTQAEPIRIKSLSAFESHRTLGVWTSPSGNMRTQLQKSQANSKRHTKRIGFCTSPKEARTYYHSFFQTSVGYTNCCTSFTEKEARSIEKDFTSRALNKCGFSKHLEGTVTWALPKRGGAGFMGINTEQGLAKCMTAIKLLRSNGQPAKEFRILLTWIQAQSGFHSSIICDDTRTELPHLRATWIPCLRRFLHKNGLRLRLEQKFSPPPQREHDIFLMEWLLANQPRRFKDDEIRMIATCREFLQVTTLAEIATVDGLCISITAWKGPAEPPRPTERRPHMFNVIRRPPLRAWNLWRKALLPLIFNPTERRLRNPLGTWICNAAQTRVIWPIVYSPAENKMYATDNTGRYFRCQETTHQRFARTDTVQTELPVDCVPAATTSIAFPQQVYRLEHWDPMTPPPAQNPEDEELMTTIQAMEDWERTLLTFIVTHHSTAALRQIYATTQGTCASNCFIRAETASYGWKWCDPAGNLIAQCSGHAPGLNPTKLRAHAYGYLSFTRFLLLLERETNQTTTQPQTFYADCHGLTKRLAQHRKYSFENPSQTLWAEWDVTNMLHQSIETLRGRIREGRAVNHQDDQRAYAPPPLQARINREAAVLAEQFIGNHPDPVTFAHQFPAGGCTLENRKGTITGQYKIEIRDAATWPNLQTYLCKRFNWEHHLAERIDWEAMGTALSSQRKHQSTLVKHLTRQAPTGHIAHRNDKRKDPSCFSCTTEASEDNNHVIRCPCDRTAKWRADYLADIHNSLNRKSLHSDPRLLTILREGMRRWLDNIGTPLPITAEYPERYHPLITEQNQLGWDQVLRGRLSLHWRSLQQEYITACHIKGTSISGQIWTRTVAKHAIAWWLKAWEGRNEDRFGNSPEMKKAQHRTQLQRELNLLYEQRPNMQEVDTYIFSESVEAHMATTPDDNLPLQNWINLNSPAIRRSILANTATQAP